MLAQALRPHNAPTNYPPWSNNMQRSTHLASILSLSLSLSLGTVSVAAHANTDAAAKAGTHAVQVQQIRNATARISYAGKIFLLDPFLARKGKYPGFEG